MDNPQYTDEQRLALLEELDRLKRVDKTADDLAEFVKTYLAPHIPSTVPKFHYEIYNLLSVFHPRTLVIAPRGFAKSTLTSRFLPLNAILTGKAKDVIIVSATVALAKEHLRMIRQELEVNNLILQDFGYQKSEKWTEDHLILNNGAQIRAKGRGFQIRGFRPDLIICDDLEDEEVIYSKEQRDKMEAWFFRTLLPALKPSQRLVYIGTILHQYSLINKLKEKSEFQVKIYRALTDDKSIWEELFPTEYLKKLRTEMGLYAFEAEYQNNPIALENQPIKPEYLDCQDLSLPKRLRVMAVDPAISEKEVADYSAIHVFDRTEQKTTSGTTKMQFKCIARDKAHWGVDALSERIIEMFLTYKPDRILLEEFAYQKVLRFILINKSRERNIFLPISTAVVHRVENTGRTDKRPLDKMTRLLQVLPLFEQKLVYIPFEETKQELLGFPFGDHDDEVDAAVYALYFLMKYQSPATIVKDKESLGIETKKTIHLKPLPNGEFMAVHEPMKINVNPSFINTMKPR